MAFLRSEIAKLVLDYLKDEGLSDAHRVFCESSPFLKEEYVAMKNGYIIDRLSNVQLVDLLLELAELRNIVKNYINNVSSEISKQILNEKNISKKLKLILNTKDRRSLKRTASRSDLVEVSFGHEPPNTSSYIPSSKRRRTECWEQSPNNLMTAHVSGLSSIKKNFVPYAESDSDEQQQQLQLQQQQQELQQQQQQQQQQRLQQQELYRACLETTLENTEFQNVLADNINKILDEPQENCENIDSNGNDTRRVYDQVNSAIQSIIQKTEKNPLFDEIVHECLHSSLDVNWQCNNENKLPVGHTSSTPRKEDDDNDACDLPLKQRLRKPKLTATKAKYKTPTAKSTKNKSTEVKIISDEPYTGNIQNMINTISGNNTETDENSVSIPVSQFYILNSNENNLNASNTNLLNPCETIYINVPSIMMGTDGVPIPIYFDEQRDATTLQTGMVVNTEYISNVEKSSEQIASPEELVDGAAAVCDEIQSDTLQTSMKENTPLPTSKINYLKVKSLSTPRRKTSHVRVLNFNTPADFTCDRNVACEFQGSNTMPKAGCSNVVDGSSSGPAKIDTTTRNKVPPADMSKTDLSDKEHPAGLNEPDKLNSTDEPMDSNQDGELAVAVSSIAMVETPKVRKKERQSCCRVLSAQKPNAEESMKISDDTKKSNTSLNPLDEWKQFRSIKPNDWDKHIRTINTGKKTPYFRRKKKKRVLKSNTVSETAKTPKSEHSANESDKEAKLSEKIKSPVGKPKRVRKKTVSKGSPISIKLSPKKMKRPSRFKSKIPKIKPSEKSSIKETTTAKDSSFISKNENSTSLKCHTNIASLLETPFKDTTSNNVPDTPRFAVPPVQETPMVKLSQKHLDKNSVLKCPEFPTPNFAITPGVSLTPQCSSPRSGAYSNRPTDYSSGSSYYKPDESDDIDKNFDAMIKSQPINLSESDKMCTENVQKIENDHHHIKDDKSIEKSEQSSCSSSNKSKSSFNTVIHADIGQWDDDKKSSKRWQKDIFDKLEHVRMRTIKKLKNGPEIIKPKAISVTDKRFKSQAAKREKQMQLSLTTSRPKRKMSSPMKRIYVSFNNETEPMDVKKNIMVKEERPIDIQTERLLSHSNDNDVLEKITPGDTVEIKVETNTTLNEDEESKLETVNNSAVAMSEISKNDSTISQTETCENLSKSTLKTPQPKEIVLSRTEQEKFLFGDTTMSDIDCTPAKNPEIQNTNISRNLRRDANTSMPPNPTSADVQHLKSTLDNIKDSPDSISDSESDYDAFDCCALSYMDDNKSNQYYESCYNVNNSIVNNPPKNNSFKSLNILKNDRKVQLRVIDEIIIFTNTSNSKTKAVISSKVSGKNRKSDESNAKPIKFNIKYKKDNASKLNKTETADDVDSTASTNENNVLMQQDNKDIDINRVLLKIHPSS